MYTLEFVSDKQISNITFIYTSEFLTDNQISDICIYTLEFLLEILKYVYK